jgi:hypothetical protein
MPQHEAAVDAVRRGLAVLGRVPQPHRWQRHQGEQFAGGVLHKADDVVEAEPGPR